MSTLEESSRREASERIKKKPSLYKVCEGCGSIVVKKTVICPNCNAYRFDDSQARVLEQAELLGSRQPLSIDKDDYA
jgi:uncharacterized OB-fold protein